MKYHRRINHGLIQKECLMRKSIELAKLTKAEGKKSVPKVGAVLSTKEGDVLLTAYSGETNSGHHCEYEILEKAEQNNISLDDAILFVTLEPCTVRGTRKEPCSKRINKSGLKEVYIGMLDPNPLIRGKGEMFLREEKIVVNRYPDELIRELYAINEDFLKEYRSTFLPNDFLYSLMKITELLKDTLEKQGYIVPKLPSSFEVTLDDVISYCASANPGADIIEIKKVIMKALGEAYDKKYLDRAFDTEVRGKYNQWQKEFFNVLEEYNITSLRDRDVLVVGIGNGEEGRRLYNDANNLTFVDIASKSLIKAGLLFLHAKRIVASAQDLSGIRVSSIDLYVLVKTKSDTC
jgi:pyrimidine deaminase RibD-like protein